jgi:hypothetical protein
MDQGFARQDSSIRQKRIDHNFPIERSKPHHRCGPHNRQGFPGSFHVPRSAVFASESTGFAFGAGSCYFPACPRTSRRTSARRDVRMGGCGACRGPAEWDPARSNGFER